jgi:16S rRNA processing protein RimM
MIDYFELGRILKPQGTRGEVKVEAYTDDINRFYDLPHLYFKQGEEYVKNCVETARTDGKHVYLTLSGVKDRNTAEQLRGMFVYIDRAHAAVLPEGHYYIRDLIGLCVKNHHGKELGTLKEILQTGASDIYVVGLKRRGTLSFPSAPGVILARDLEGGYIIVDGEKLHEVAIYDF